MAEKDSQLAALVYSFCRLIFTTRAAAWSSDAFVFFFFFFFQTISSSQLLLVFYLYHHDIVTDWIQERTSRTNTAQRLVLVVHSTNIYSSTQLGLRVNYCSAFCSSTFTAQYQYSTGFFRAQPLQLMTNTAQSKGHSKTVDKPKESKFKKFLMYFM